MTAGQYTTSLLFVSGGIHSNEPLTFIIITVFVYLLQNAVGAFSLLLAQALAGHHGAWGQIFYTNHSWVHRRCLKNF